MNDPDNSIQFLRKQVIEAKDHLEHARYRLDALELIFEGLKDGRAQAAAQKVFGLAKEKLNEVDDGLDNILPGIVRSPKKSQRRAGVRLSDSIGPEIYRTAFGDRERPGSPRAHSLHEGRHFAIWHRRQMPPVELLTFRKDIL